MEFNVGKFNVLKLRRNESIKTEYTYLAPGNSHLIIDNETVRDLGVIVNNQATYTDHIANIYSKISQRADLLLRILEKRSIEKWNSKIDRKNKVLQTEIDGEKKNFRKINTGLASNSASIISNFAPKIELTFLANMASKMV